MTMDKYLIHMNKRLVYAISHASTIRKPSLDSNVIALSWQIISQLNQIFKNVLGRQKMNQTARRLDLHT